MSGAFRDALLKITKGNVDWGDQVVFVKQQKQAPPKNIIVDRADKEESKK